MKLGTQIAILLGVALAAPAVAQKASADHSARHGEVRSQSGALSAGEVRKVDKSAKKISIKHGPLTNLDMPAMTMVFQVRDPKMLEKVKAGDKIRFTAEKIGGQYTVTQVEPAK